MLNPSHPDFGKSLLSLVTGSEPAMLRDDEVFIKTSRGRMEAAKETTRLPRRLRMLLILVDGQRSMADFRRGLTRFRSLDECFDMLRRMGFIERIPVKFDY